MNETRTRTVFDIEISPEEYERVAPVLDNIASIGEEHKFWDKIFRICLMSSYLDHTHEHPMNSPGFDAACILPNAQLLFEDAIKDVMAIDPDGHGLSGKTLKVGSIQLDFPRLN